MRCMENKQLFHQNITQSSIYDYIQIPLKSIVQFTSIEPPQSRLEALKNRDDIRIYSELSTIGL